MLSGLLRRAGERGGEQSIIWGSGMTENQRRESDVLCARDLVLRGITFIGLIVAVLVALLAVQWT
jgi:hypothetical protein